MEGGGRANWQIDADLEFFYSAYGDVVGRGGGDVRELRWSMG